MTESHSEVWDGWDRVADVIVVGSGAAGFAAAITAAQEGRRVLLLEKAQTLGGTTSHSSGTMWIPNNPLMQRRGLQDPREPALRYLARTAYPALYDPDDPDTLGLGTRRHRLLAALYDVGPTAFGRLRDAGALPVDDDDFPTLPDYYAEEPDNVAPLGRSVRIKMPDDYIPGTGTTGGQTMIARMESVARELGVEILLGRRATELVKDESGAVVGVSASSRTGVEIFGARRGVVFATGGFAHNPELLSTYLRGPVLASCGSPSATGDFVHIGMQAGAMLANMANAWWDEVVVEAAARSRVTSRDCIYPFGDSMVIVDGAGHRVMNEKQTYNERGQVHHHWNADRRDYSRFLLYMVFDNEVLEDRRPSRHRYPVPLGADGREHVISADTLPELAVAIDRALMRLRRTVGGRRLDPGFTENLIASIERFNEMARGGVDIDHRRGETAIERAWSTEPRTPAQPNPAMHEFSPRGPYHCIILGPGVLDTKGGPAVDELAQVLAHDETPIPGLYGAGNCIGSPTGQAYYGPGATIGPALTFGVIAGESAAARPEHAPVFAS